MKLSCIVVDDEQLARSLLEDFTGKVSFLDLVGTFKNPLDAMSYLQQHEVDLMFLDIQMPDLTGIELLKSLSQPPQVILTTAYSEYALDGYELNVCDYLLKPFSFNRFLQAVNKAAEVIKLKKAPSSSRIEPYITIHADHKIFRVPVQDILYIEGLKEYVSYYTKSGQRIIALQSLKNIERDLEDVHFIRVHRSYIVPIEKINALEGNQLRIDGKLIPIGRSYKDQVLKKVFPS